MQNQKLDRLISTAYIEIDIRESFIKAWEMYKSRALLHSSYMMLMLTIQGAFVLYASQFSILYSLILAPPLYSGFFLVANKISMGEQVNYGSYFGGFNYWILMFSIWLIAQILISIGLILLVIPGIYLAVSYMFAVLFGIFGGFDFWKSLEYSRKLVGRNFWQFLGLAVLLLLINVGPAALSLVSPNAAMFYALWLCVSFPVSFFVLYVIFEDLVADALIEEEPTNLEGGNVLES